MASIEDDRILPAHEAATNEVVRAVLCEPISDDSANAIVARQPVLGHEAAVSFDGVIPRPQMLLENSVSPQSRSKLRILAVMTALFVSNTFYNMHNLLSSAPIAQKTLGSFTKLP